MNWPPSKICTGVGSLSSQDPQAAVHWIFDTFPDLPWWPQLPRCVTLQESWIGKIPGSQFNDHGCQVSWQGDTFVEGLRRHYLSKRHPDPLITEPGYRLFLKEMEEVNFFPGHIFKGQVFGPVTLGSLIKDSQNKTALDYPQAVEILSEFLFQLCRQQAQDIYDRGGEPLIVIDEPVISQIPSHVTSLKKLLLRLKKHMRVGYHCCGRASRGDLLALPWDYVNVDLFYVDELVKCRQIIQSLIERGGCLALGVVPTFADQDLPDLLQLYERMMICLEKLFPNSAMKSNISQKIILTPACGTGTLSKKHEKKVYDFLRELTQLL